MTDRVDNFNRADSASSLGTPSDGGSAWVPNSGAWGISGNAGYNPGSTAQGTAILEASISDADVQVTLSTIGATSDSGICCRSSDDSNNIVTAANVVSTFYKAFKRVAGSFTQLGSTYTATPVSGDVVRCNANGSNLTIYVNAVSRITATDSFNSTATKHGLRANADILTRFDTFSITALSASSRPVKMAGLWGGFAGESGGFAG